MHHFDFWDYTHGEGPREPSYSFGSIVEFQTFLFQTSLVLPCKKVRKVRRITASHKPHVLVKGVFL
jgi:hypothetical protein